MQWVQRLRKGRRTLTSHDAEVQVIMTIFSEANEQCLSKFGYAYSFTNCSTFRSLFYRPPPKFTKIGYRDVHCYRTCNCEKSETTQMALLKKLANAQYSIFKDSIQILKGMKYICVNNREACPR